MSHWLKRLYWRLEVLFRKERAEAELEEEIRYHLEREIEANLRAGMSPEEARRVAMADFGGVERTKEQVRDVRGARILDDLLQDLRYTIRGLIKRPGFTSVIVITLALGIGANTAIFSVLRNVVLRPFPYAEPDRLVTVWTPQIGYSFNPLSAPDWLDFREASESFEAWGVYQMGAMNLSGDAMPERVMGVRVTAGVLQTLGTVAARGRLFTEEETEDPVARAVIVSDGLWRSRFGADPDLIGREILINRESWTVIGILSSDFRFPGWQSLAEPGLLIPLALGVTATDRGSYYLRVIGRLREGISVQRADEELNTIAARLAGAYPETNDRRIARVIPLRDIVLGDSATRLWILLGVTGIVLLIACTNVAGLLMARNAGRKVEMAVRASMGAGRRRLLRQMLTESLVVALVGGTAGLLLAWWGIGMLGGVMPGTLPRVDQLRIDTIVVLFACGLALFTGVLFGIFPALTTSAVDLTSAFREGARTLTAGRSRTRFLGAMIVAQFALTFVLADAAALMLRSLWQATGSRELHEPGQVLVAGYLTARERGEESIVTDPFLEPLRERLQALPGVQSVGVSTRLPLVGGWSSGILAEGQDYDPEIDRGYVNMVCASPGYFDAMGIGLLRGRDLRPEDSEEGHLGVVVNRRFAEQSWPGQNPVGKRIRANAATPWFEAVIVGVVEDVRQNGLESRIEPGVYLPFFPPFTPNRWIAIRTAGEPMALVPELRRQLVELDPHLPLTQIFTAEELYGFMATQRRLTTQLIGLFALVALSLVAAGTYGVMAFLVRQRTHEMGVRVALGASRAGVVRLVLGRTLRLALVGIVLGLLGAVVASDVVGSLLYGVGPLDPIFLIGAVAFLILVAMSAAAVPALRAVRIDPVEVMRAE
ncbi:MAG: FtsX-like permease family protein [Gemmatimonadetes bacterium]|nr:FtsX-like permease family protein [Gemmatimonadota bacterium]NIO30933.1 FtsX-like permease family protein [Gemmatimonadota bacterium]